MDTDLKITWDVPFYEQDLSPDSEDLSRATKAIGEFTDSPATFEWFKARGYTLFQRSIISACEGFPFPSEFYPRLPYARSAQADYPFPHHSREFEDEEGSDKVHARMGKIWYAQDTQGRHVVLKLMPENSDELRVCEFIREQSLETLKRVCILPVLDILDIPDYRFVVMPKWGVSIRAPTPNKLQVMVEILHSMLKAVDFLHSHNIVHRDISQANMLVNHYSDRGPHNPVRFGLRSAGKLSYALFDFDLAVVFPPQAERSKCRLPMEKTYQGSWPQPHWDRSPGELDYDPFAFDVGCLGLIFRLWIQHFTGDLPFLAPLLDRMTTSVQRRFTAREALRFFEEHVGEVRQADLAKRYRENRSDMPLEQYDLWSALSAEEAARWAAYRGPHPASKVEAPASAIVSP